MSTVDSTKYHIGIYYSLAWQQSAQDDRKLHRFVDVPRSVLHTPSFSPIPNLSPSTLSILHTVSGKKPTYSRIVFTLVIPSSLIISHQAVDTEAGKHVAPGPGIVSPPLLPDH